MASSPQTVEFLLGQLSGVPEISARKMFGEYAIYGGGKVVALVCDDQLFVKPTEAGRGLIGTVTEAPPYTGAKPHYLISGDRCEDAEWLCALIAATAAALPAPKQKKRSRVVP